MRARPTTRLAWSLCALSFVLTMLGLLLLIVSWSPVGVPSYASAPVFDYWLESALMGISFSAVGVVIAPYLPPQNPIGWIFCAIGLIAGMRLFSAEYAVVTLLAEPGSVLGMLPGGEALAWLSSWLWIPLIGVFMFLALLFPNGRLPSPRWRPFAWLVGAVVVVGAVGVALWPETVGGLYHVNHLESPTDTINPMEMILYPLALVATSSLLIRLRRSKGVERQQVKWFAYAAAVLAVSTTLTYGFLEAANVGWLQWVSFLPAVVGYVGLPVAVGIAILKYRLYDIDIVINRTLVYGALTGCVVGIYILVVGGLGMLFQSSATLLNSLVGTGVVAIVFAPLRDRLQRGVNRLMYGERDDPYAVISRLGQRLEATIEPRAMLPTIVETVAQALKLPYAAIALKERTLKEKNPAREESSSEHEGEERFAVVASWGSPVEYAPLVLPLTYGQETIGELILAPRARGENFSPADRRLLEDLARQTEVAAYAVRLTEDLQRARERLVSTREEERRRLRRDLHDGLGPQLSGQALTIDAIRSLLKRDPAAAEELLVDLKTQTRSAASDIRRLVYALRPPALDSLGLVGALRKRAAQCEQDGSLRVYVKAPEEMPPLPAAVEVACYRIAEEALTNVVRHSAAQTSTLSLAIDEGALRLEVRDDGRGLPDSRAGELRRAGVGLASMRERATELGGRLLVVNALPEGGTCVRAELPLPEEEE